MYIMYLCISASYFKCLSVVPPVMCYPPANGGMMAISSVGFNVRCESMLSYSMFTAIRSELSMSLSAGYVLTMCVINVCTEGGEGKENNNSH